MSSVASFPDSDFLSFRDSSRLSAGLRSLMVLALVILCCVGCGEGGEVSRLGRHRRPTPSTTDHLSHALDYLEHMDDYDESIAHSQAMFQLNRWLDTQRLGSDWKPDEMTARLPRTVRERGVLDELQRQRFTPDDVRAIQEAVWMRQLSQWVSRQPLDPLIADWLEGRRAELGDDAAQRLATAYRLFDWVVRNIQLDELLASPDESTAAPVAGTGGGSGAATPEEPAAWRGIPGPGYSLQPVQVLTYGHGDAWQRMRLLTLLARQQGLDVVTLAFPGRTIPPRPRPWLSGVLLGEDLYLLDMRLGLPILGRDRQGMATLREVLADPTLLKNMETDAEHTYVVPAEDLSEVVALIDVVAANLAQRTKVAEQQLVGEDRTVLHVPISPLANRLRACQGIRDVYLWSIPFEADWYRLATERRLREDPQAASLYFMQNSMFLNRTPLLRGRIAYLRGDIEKTDDDPGAKTLLMQVRIPNENLKDLGTDEELQRRLGLTRDPRLNEQQFAMQVEVFRGMLTRTKEHASFWLGVCQLESGRPDAALEWLSDRTLEVSPDGPWTPLARYNLARAYEALGDLAKAQRLLLADKSLQEHGNFLRARLLEKRIAAESSPPAVSARSSDAPESSGR